MQRRRFGVNIKNLILLTSVILTVYVILHVHILFRYDDDDINPKLKIIQANIDFDHSLCEKKIKHKEVMMTSQFHSCPKNGIVTVKEGGRLANQIWEYASVFAFARQYGFEPYVPRCLRDKLEEIFENLTLPALDKIAHCSIDLSTNEPTIEWINKFVVSMDKWNDRSRNIVVLPRWVALTKTVVVWFQDINRELVYKRELREKADNILRIANKKHHTLPVYVGIHVRRTDYSQYLGKRYKLTLITSKFFYKAMDYFEQNYQSVVFVVVSDDPDWCSENLTEKPNVYIVGNKTSPGQDLAIMAACNHSIIDYGSYGLWGAMQAGGETIMYNMTDHPTERVAKLLTNFHIFS